MAIKMTVPFDTPTIAEEYAERDRQFKETFEVRTSRGLVAERITHKVRSGQSTLKYLGKDRQIHGEGFQRFITI